MKNIIFIILIGFSLLSCKKDDPEPVSKSAPLIIEMNGIYSEDVYCKVSLSEPHQNSEYYTSDTSTVISYTLTKPSFKGGTTISFGSYTYKRAGGIASASGASSTFTIKVTYNGQILANQTFNKGYNIGVNVALPFVQ